VPGNWDVGCGMLALLHTELDSLVCLGISGCWLFLKSEGVRGDGCSLQHGR